MRYVYQVESHGCIGSLYFSSMKKAEDYCRQQECKICTYSDNYLRQYESYDKQRCFDIKKETVK